MKFMRFAAGLLAVMLMLSSVAFAAAYQKLQRGDSGTQVREMQQALKDLGYDLTVDGRFGSGTERAVKLFQKDQRLTQDGVAGYDTQVLLYSDSAIMYNGSLAGSLTMNYETLKKGMTGDAVKQLQSRLIELKYLSGTPDGV